MKKLILTFAVAAFVSAPVFAQEGAPEPTREERLAELHRLMRKASEEMNNLERELARASRDAPRADVIAERMQRIRKAMEQGRLDELPEGLRKHIEQSPEEAAELTGKSAEEVRNIARDSEALEELLKQHPELLKKLAENERTMEAIQRHQHEAERKLEETLRRQRESADAANRNVDEAINVAHTLRGG
jgi:chromosome segregation ATPase